MYILLMAFKTLQIGYRELEGHVLEIEAIKGITVFIWLLE